MISSVIWPSEDLIASKDDLGPDFSGTVANLHTNFCWMRMLGKDLPVTINSGEQTTCYICCPTAAYIHYAREELRNFSQSKIMRTMLGCLISAMAPLVSATGFDRQIQPNNRLFATSIWCGFDRDQIASVTSKLVRKYPSHVPTWRSLNDVSDKEVLDGFVKAGYNLYAARQVYLYDCRRNLPAKGRDLKRDLRLLESAGYSLVRPVDFRAEDAERIARLYGMLYLEKYTTLNPQYTPSFINLVRQNGSVEFHGLRDRAGVLAGVIGFYRQGDVMTAPIVGYDTLRSQADGLYRQLIAISLLKARDERLLYNMSAGVAGFKRARGARPAIEYSAIYNRHLPVSRRLAAWVMRAILNGIAVPIMRSQKL